MKLKRLISNIILGATIVTLSLGISGCSKENTSESTLNKETLIVGMDDAFAPMGFKDENGEITGFDVELAKAICEKLNKKVVFQPIDWTMKETELKSGNIDLIWNGYTINEERKKKVDFSVPYLKNKQGQLYIDHVRGIYNVLKRIKDKYPNVPMMLCSGGGARCDYEALKYYTEFWCSDNTDARARMSIQYGTGLFYRKQA